MDGKDLGLLARVFMGLLKIAVVLLKLAAFTGLLWFLLPIGLGLLVEIVSGQPFHPNYTNPVLFFLIDKVLWYAALPLAVLTFTQNIVRMAKKDRSFSWLGLVMKRQAQGIVAKADGDTLKMVGLSLIHI